MAESEKQTRTDSNMLLDGAKAGFTSGLFVANGFAWLRNAITQQMLTGGAFKVTPSMFTSGLAAFNVAILPTVGTTVFVDHLLTEAATKYGYDSTAALRFYKAVASGIIGGMIGSVPEAIAQHQVKTTPKPSFSTSLMTAQQAHGSRAWGIGMPMTILRQKQFALGYLWMMPELSLYARKNIADHPIMDVVVALGVGGVLAVTTAPFNTVRFEQHNAMMKTGHRPSAYATYQHYVQRGGGFFRSLVRPALGPRAVLTAATVYTVHEVKNWLAPRPM